MNNILQGDSWQLIKQLEDESVDCVVTSPPYWGLRDYGVEGQAGLEEHPQLWVDKMVELCELLKPKLKKSGVMFWNIGETYFGSGGAGGDYKEGGLKEGQPKFKQPDNGQWERPSRDAFKEAGINKKCLLCGKEISTGKGGQFCSRECLNKKGNDFRSQNRTNWLQPKQLLGLPWRFAIAMQDKGWILRNSIIWDKPNHMPSSVKDRFSNGYEYVFMFVKSRKYWFDLDAVREPHQGPIISKYSNTKISIENAESMNSPRARVHRKPFTSDQAGGGSGIKGHSGYYKDNGSLLLNPNIGKNCGDVWRITTKPHPFAHFAVFPEQLAERCIKSGCPEWVCKKCGKPRERIVNKEYTPIGNNPKSGNKLVHGKRTSGNIIEGSITPQELKYGRASLSVETVGWSDCGCNAGFSGGVVLDPFMGSGTVAVVAKRLNRQYVGFELSEKYIQIAERRLSGVDNWDVIKDIESGVQKVLNGNE